MKVFLAIFLFLILPVFVFASPFLVCDPQTGVVKYKITGATFIPITVPAQPDGSLKVDVAQAPVGTTTIQVQACNGWEECSTTVPFDLERPPVPLSSKGLQIVR